MMTKDRIRNEHICGTMLDVLQIVREARLRGTCAAEGQ